MSKDFPREDFDVFLDVPRLRVGKSHDSLEKVLAIGLGFGYRQRPEAFQITADSVFLLDSKANCNKGFQQEYGVDACDKAFFLLFPPDTTDCNAVRWSIFWCNAFEVGMDCASALVPRELNETPSCVELLQTPSFSHCVKITVQFQGRLEWIHGVWIEGLVRK